MAMSEKSDPEIIDVEYEVLEGEPEGPVIDAEPVVEERRKPRPEMEAGAPGAILGSLAGEVLGRRPGLAKAVTIGLGLWGLKTAYDSEKKKKQRRKRKKKMKRILRRHL